MNTKNFGRIVRHKRECLGLTISETANRCGMSARGLESIELGDSDPKLSSVLRICATLNIELGEIASCVPLI